ncbi:MAG TPA: acetaldehyde dehydrogenase (acetylating), partial [Bacillus sp. (in: firmicutes)]|nr:acetaldehyde dehydrogenase (acetylating) [Bacillus sp. (in: firmicutes)]
MAKLKAAIIGSGNIGTDLMVKLGRSEHLELTAVIGIDPQSDGLRRAKEAGYAGVDTGIDGFLADPTLEADIIFDATSAKAHIYNDKVCQERGIKMIDL